MSLRGGTTKQSHRMYEREEIATLSLAMTCLFICFKALSFERVG